MTKNSFFTTMIVFQIMCSCSMPSYRTYYESVPYAVDYTNKKWLLTPIKGESESLEKQDSYATNELKSCLGENLIEHFDSKSGYMLAKNTDISPNLYLQTLQTTDLDYWIEIKNSIKRENNSGNVSVKSSFNNTFVDIVVTINIYDIKQSDLIYSQKVKGSLSTEGSKDDVVLHKSTSGIQYKALQKAVKNLKKNMLCKK